MGSKVHAALAVPRVTSKYDPELPKEHVPKVNEDVPLQDRFLTASCTIILANPEPYILLSMSKSD